jgi:hypothetical protein
MMALNSLVPEDRKEGGKSAHSRMIRKEGRSDISAPAQQSYARRAVVPDMHEKRAVSTRNTRTPTPRTSLGWIVQRESYGRHA